MKNYHLSRKPNHDQSVRFHNVYAAVRQARKGNSEWLDYLKGVCMGESADLKKTEQYIRAATASLDNR